MYRFLIIAYLFTLGKSLETETFYEVSLFADANSNGYGGYLEMYENTLEAGRSKVSHKEDIRPPGAGYCRSPEVGCMSQEVDGEIPPEVGGSMSPEVDGIRPLEVGRCKLNVDAVKLPVFSSRPAEVGEEVQTENSQYVEIQKHEIYSLSKIIPAAEGVSMISCKGKQYSGVIFGDWDDKERLRSSTWRESETERHLINSNIEVSQNKKIKIFSDNKNVQSVLQIYRKSHVI